MRPKLKITWHLEGHLENKHELIVARGEDKLLDTLRKVKPISTLKNYGTLCTTITMKQGKRNKQIP